MKTAPRILVVCLFVLLICTANQVFAKAPVPQTNWDAFSQNLVAALASPVEGLQQSAMQQIIQYGDHLDVRRGAIYIMRIFRNHEDVQMRRLALSALSRTHSKWAMGLLTVLVDVEQSPMLKRQIYLILNDYRSS